MPVRLTRLATGKVIGDLLARRIFPVTKDVPVRETISTMNHVEGNIEAI